MRYNIKKLRQQKFPGRGGQAQCAEALGVTRQAWSRYENATSLHSKTLEEIAALLGVEVDDLLADDGPDEAAAADITVGMPVGVMLPLFGEAAAATGGKDSFYSDESYEMFEIPAGVGMVTVRGESMEPLARSGQKVFLRPHGEAPKNGDLVVVWTRHSEHARQLFKRWGGWLPKTRGRTSPEDVLVLISVNPIDTVNIVEHILRRDYGGHRIVAGVWYG